jgi:monoterpene epsilon-lactone hydrolase
LTSPEMKAVLDLGRAGPAVDADTVEERRRNTEALLAGALAPGATEEASMIGGREALWFRPPSGGLRGTVLYLHGGAFEVGSPAAYRAFASNLAVQLDAEVVVPAYRLAPEHPFPAAVEDCTSAYEDLLRSGRPPGSIALIGDSAGGGLTVSTLLAAVHARLPQPACGAAISGWFDLTLSAPSYERCAASDPFIRRSMLSRAAAAYLAGTDPLNPLASPMHAGPDDLSALAPLLLQAAANEVLADDSSGLATRIADAGGFVQLELCPEAFHVWHLAGEALPESRASLETLTAFVHDRWTAGS